MHAFSPELDVCQKAKVVPHLLSCLAAGKKSDSGGGGDGGEGKATEKESEEGKLAPNSKKAPLARPEEEEDDDVEVEVKLRLLENGVAAERV